VKFDQKKLKGWAATKEVYLPGLTQLFAQSKSNILMIGASVFELYQIQGWIPPLKRKTGDIDLSVGIIGDASLYEAGIQILLSLKYTVDEIHPYRYRPSQNLPGGYSYIDLLAHPGDSFTSSSVAVQAMGVGDGFSFKAFDFAQKETFSLEKNVAFPNPFGLIALKQESYLDEPVRRVKDFADIVELISGLVEKGMHFELDDLWKKVSPSPEAKRLKEMLGLMTTESTRWDLDDVRNDLLQRNFDVNFIEETLPQRIKDFCDFLNS
jgi:predicted nucleotidyltransferase